MNTEATPGHVASTEGLGALVDVLARWEDRNGSMAAITPDEWAALRQEVAAACVTQSPRMLRNEIRRLREWIAVEGLHSDTCTRNVLGRVCDGCRCGALKA